MFAIGRPRNDTNIKASTVLSFNGLMRSLFTRFWMGKSTFTYIGFAKPKLLSFHSRNCKSNWNLKVFARVPRLKSNYLSICKLQPLYFVASNFWRGIHCDQWKLCRAHFCEVPAPPPPRNLIKIKIKKTKNKKTSLTAKMAFDRCWRLPILNSGDACFLHVP